VSVYYLPYPNPDLFFWRSRFWRDTDEVIMRLGIGRRSLRSRRERWRENTRLQTQLSGGCVCDGRRQSIRDTCRCQHLTTCCSHNQSTTPSRYLCPVHISYDVMPVIVAASPCICDERWRSTRPIKSHPGCIESAVSAWAQPRFKNWGSSSFIPVHTNVQLQ